MPEAKKTNGKQPVQPVAPTPPPPAPAPEPESVQWTPPDLPVKYPDLTIDEYSTVSPKGPLDVQWCKDALGWETEKEWQKRMVEEELARGNTTAKPEHFLFGDGVALAGGGFHPVHCRNLAGEKVICWNNGNNRPFDEAWSFDALAETVLSGKWAGPFTVPGETVNGETVRISKYGRVISGAHQMSACIRAGEKLTKARADGVDHPDEPRYPAWRKHGEPFIETIVIKGVSEDPRVLMTIDYVKPRSAADVFYTSDVFRAAPPPERKELCKMLSSATDLAWTRTDTKGYRTHPEVVGFLDRHKRLLDCVQHLFAENRPAAGRRIAKHRLGAGQCAALMFIMGSAGPKTNGDDYRNEEPPSQKNLDWSLWDKAEEFWTLLASRKDFQPVRDALTDLRDSTPQDDVNQGLGGRIPEKFAILSNAWGRWKDHIGGGTVFDDSDLEPGGILHLEYSALDAQGKELPNGQVALVNVADFGGIDCPEATGKGKTAKSPPTPPPPKQEDIWFGPNAKGPQGPVPTAEQLKQQAASRRGR